MTFETCLSLLLSIEITTKNCYEVPPGQIHTRPPDQGVLGLRRGRGSRDRLREDLYPLPLRVGDDGAARPEGPLTPLQGHCVGVGARQGL